MSEGLEKRGKMRKSDSSLPQIAGAKIGIARSQGPALFAGQVGAFSALIAIGTVLSNLLFGFVLPYPLYEITAAPAFYLAIAVLYPWRVSFWSTAIGSAVGEAISIFFLGGVPAFALTFIPGIVVARAPETLIVHKFREKAVRWISASMAVATVYETLAFFFIDWPIYSFTVFYQGCPQSGPCIGSGLVGGFWLAASDFGTMIDLLWIPVAMLLIFAVRRSYNTRFFG